MAKLGNRKDGTFGIPSHALTTLQHKAELLNRRAVKLGGGLGIEVVGSDSLKNDSGRILPIVVIRIMGSVPAVAGFQFAARLEHHTGGNIISVAPGFEAQIPEQYREAQANCDHCKWFRRRNDTFVLRNEQGEFVQVGRSCLQDYLRGADPSSALKLFSLLTSLFGCIASNEDGFGGGFSGGDGFSSTTHFLACTVASIRSLGWTSKKTAFETGKMATATDALFLSGPCPLRGEDAIKSWTENQPTDADLEEAADVVEWAGELGGRDNLSDYLHNLRVACSIGHVEHKQAGIIASGVIAHRIEKERLEKAASPARAASQYVGTVGERLTLCLTVTRVRYIESQYGVKTMVALEDESGNQLVWWATNNPNYQGGERIVCKATVKKHDTYNGVAQTTLTRLSAS